MTRFYIIFLFLTSLFIQTTNAQTGNGSIKGSVKTSDGKPAPYVSVGLNRSAKGTTTDEEGNYLLTDIKPGNHILKVSFVGLISKATRSHLFSIWEGVEHGPYGF